MDPARARPEALGRDGGAPQTPRPVGKPGAPRKPSSKERRSHDEPRAGAKAAAPRQGRRPSPSKRAKPPARAPITSAGDPLRGPPTPSGVTRSGTVAIVGRPNVGKS